METTDVRRPIYPQGPAWPRLFDAFTRRAFDIFASALGLILLSPLFAVMSLAILRDSPGPVFYRGPRVGKNGKLFGILKFRTMYERPDCYEGPKITACGDARITRLGHWLRDTKVNELPQLWNVLIGDMSLVGPRPEDPEIAKGWPAKVREDLLSVRPGITSPATVVFRSEEAMLKSSNVMDDYLRTILPNKLRLDAIYVRNRNLLTDLDVIFMTMLLLLPQLRKSEVPETILYWGPLSKFVSRYLNWFLLDTIATMLVIWLAGLLWRLEAPLNLGMGRWIGVSLVVALVFSIMNALLGLSNIQWRRAPAREVLPLALSSGIATMVLIVIDFVYFHHGKFQASGPHLPLGMLVITGMLSFFSFTGMRFRERLLTGFAAQWLNARKGNRAMGERVLLIGAGVNSELAVWLLTHSEFAKVFSIVGIVDDDPRKQGLYYDGFRVIGTTRDIPSLMDKHDVGLAIFTITNIEEPERHRILKACQTARAQVVILPDVMTELFAQFRGTARLQQQSAVLTIGE